MPARLAITGRDKFCPCGFESHLPGSFIGDELTADLVIFVGADLVSARMISGLYASGQTPCYMQMAKLLLAGKFEKLIDILYCFDNVIFY